MTTTAPSRTGPTRDPHRGGGPLDDRLDGGLLGGGLLDGFRERAAECDRANRYFDDDLEILRERGYLRAAVPVERGGLGLGIVELAAEQRRLARHAPATALGMGMHHYWVGIAVELERAGDPSLTWILDEAAGGAVFAAGHAEPGNDIPVLLSTATAERAQGGYRVRGRKMFGSNGPVWSFLGVHALDAGDPERPVVIHGFVRRDDPGVQVIETWDTLGMRPSQSHDTVLHDVFVPDERIGRVIPAGDGADLFLAAMDAWALSLISAVYLGIADRALELAVESAHRKTSIAIPRGADAYNPMVQHQIAEMALELDTAEAVAERLMRDWVRGVELDERWALRVVAAKWRVVESVQRVVDRALDVTGGAGMFRGNELERLYRDARCGGFHPANDALTHELVGKITLGIEAEVPRW